MSAERLRKTPEVDRFLYIDHVIVVFTAGLMFEAQPSPIRRLYAALKFN